MSETARDDAARQSPWAERRKAVRPQAVTVAREGAGDGAAAAGATTLAVKRMYEEYPYPSPLAGSSLIKDLANVVRFTFPDDDLAGWRILDAGCGTGHRLLALAQAHPGARLTGVDLSAASLGVARRMAREHGIDNVDFRQANLLDLRLPGHYDLIVSTGVVHHLSDPQLGLQNLTRHLADDGLLLVWLYHSLGEFTRLLDRELALLLWGGDRADLRAGIDVMRDLRLSLSAARYGTQTSMLAREEISQQSIDVDAYLHPIVNAYRFQEVAEMFGRAGLSWAAVNSVNRDGKSHLIDLERVSGDRDFCLDDGELFAAGPLRERYASLDKGEKLKAIELAVRPTGFSLIGGRGGALGKCDGRVRGNAVSLG